MAAKIALTGFSAFQILSFRFCGSAILLGTLFHKIIRQSNPSTIKRGLLLGVLQFTGQSVQLIGLHYTTPGKQAFLLASYVVFVPFISWFIIKIKPSLKSILAAIVTLSGVGLLSFNEQLSISLGDSLSLLFALLFALQIVVIGLFAKNLDPLQFSFFQFLSSGILSLLALVVTKNPTPVFSLATVGGLLYLVIGCTVFAFTVQNISQRYTSDASASILLSLECVFGFLISVHYGTEQVNTKMIIGCFLIFGAVLFSKLDFPKKQPQTLPEQQIF